MRYAASVGNPAEEIAYASGRDEELADGIRKVQVEENERTSGIMSRNPS